MKTSIYTGKTVIITGASAGIGKALALQLAEKKANLVLAARNLVRLEEVASICREKGAEAIAVKTDISIKEECQKLVERAVEQFSSIDFLINNAGVSMWAKFDDISDITIFDKMIRVNYLGAVYLTHYALPFLKKSQGQIIAVSSLTGKTGVPTRSGYAASKHAIAGFLDSLRIELSGTGVTVSIIYPGFVATKIRENAFNKDGNRYGQSPMKETGLMSAERCAELIIKAISRRRRELIMTAKGKIGMWIKLIAPSLVDAIARKSIKEV